MLSFLSPAMATETTTYHASSLRCHSFSHYPKLMTIDKGWEVYHLVNCLLVQPFLHHNGPVQYPHEQDSEILESLLFGHQLATTPEEAVHLY